MIIVRHKKNFDNPDIYFVEPDEERHDFGVNKEITITKKQKDTILKYHGDNKIVQIVFLRAFFPCLGLVEAKKIADYWNNK